MNFTIKTYIIFLKEEHVYTTRNMPLAQARVEKPESVVILKPGTLLYSQDKTFSIEQVAEARAQGFSHQWGFGPCAETIPFEKLTFARVDEFSM